MEILLEYRAGNEVVQKLIRLSVFIYTLPYIGLVSRAVQRSIA